MSGTQNMPNPWMVGEFRTKLTERQAAEFRLLFDDAMSVVASDAELQRFANKIDPVLQPDFYALFPSAKPQQVDLTDSTFSYDDLLDALLSGKLNGKDVDPEEVKKEIRRRNQEAGRSAAQPSTPAVAAAPATSAPRRQPQSRQRTPRQPNPAVEWLKEHVAMIALAVIGVIVYFIFRHHVVALIGAPTENINWWIDKGVFVLTVIGGGWIGHLFDRRRNDVDYDNS